MAANSVLRLNMTGLGESRSQESERYRAALDMAEYVDRHGFSVVSVEEHHCAANGWLPSPIVMASMIVARTRRIHVNITALLVTLYDPIRLAEDIAVLDLASGGRFSFVAGSGYRPIEYHALDRSWDDRGSRMDETIATLLSAWEGEPFDYKGRRIRVTPRPLTRPHPPFFIGGMSKVAARRAARFGLPFYPPMKVPELEAYYHEQLARFGNRGHVYAPDRENGMIFLDEEPERAWEELAPYFLNEAQEYSRWKQDGVPRPSEQTVETIDDLRRQGRYEILTPEECAERMRAMPTRSSMVFHPLAGGIPIDRAWNTLRLHVERVLPTLG